jgi:uncharacterized protein (TIGR03066 family)
VSANEPNPRCTGPGRVLILVAHWLSVCALGGAGRAGELLVRRGLLTANETQAEERRWRDIATERLTDRGRRGDSMRALLGCMLGLVICCELSPADDKKGDAKIDPAKLVGRWARKGDPAESAYVMEFTKDGKLTYRITVDGRENKFERTYTVDGRDLLVWLKGDFEPDSNTITTLTDAELVMKDFRRRETRFVRLKDKK